MVWRPDKPMPVTTPMVLAPHLYGQLEREGKEDMRRFLRQKMIPKTYCTPNLFNCRSGKEPSR